LRPHLARFNPTVPLFDQRPIWIHACSVGEVTTALPLVRALRDRWPQAAWLLTVSTPTGMALAREQSPIPVAWFPLDISLTVRSFFQHARPRAILLVETELWPGMLAAAHASGVPVALISGRLSDAESGNYRRLGPLWRPVLRPLAVAAMQTEVYAGRIADLGVDRARIVVTGNLKYDAAPPPVPDDERLALRAELGIAANAPVLLFGSTRDGDEALAARCYERLRDEYPGLRMIVAPRHLDRLNVAEQALEGLSVARRSAGTARSDQVILLDTHGELRRIYSVATVAVVGGSFYPGVNGHNPIEPAAQGVAPVFGPHMRNFADIAAHLIAEHAAIQVTSPEKLRGALAGLLSDEVQRSRLGAAALGVVQKNQGAVVRTIDAIAPIVSGALSAT
jgi:3-deoxy-D-manno-octulosonic-acid transferase